MDQNVVDLSHRISKGAPETPGAKLFEKKSVFLENLPEKPKKASKKDESRLQREEVQAQKETKDKLKEEEHVEVRRKVNAYLKNPKFAEMFRGVTMPEGKATDADWRAKYAEIQETLKATYKEAMVAQMFVGGARATETVMINFLGMHQMTGFADDVVAHRGDFEPELTELAIEMSNSWVPGPVPRLMFKMFTHLEKYRAKGSAKEEAPTPAPAPAPTKK